MQRLPTTSTTTTDTGLELAKWLGGAAAGALLMYMLDPDRGSARRAQSAAAVRNAGTRTTETLGNVWHSASSRMSSAADDAIETVKSATPDGGLGSTLSRMGRAAGEMLDDTVSKARDVMGRASSAAGDMADEAISKARNGMSRAESATRGMMDDTRDTSASAGRSVSDSVSQFGNRVAGSMQRGRGEGAWGPFTRNSAVVGGGLLALTGLMRRSPMGVVLGLAGAALLARGAANQPLRSLVSGRGMNMSQTIDFEKTIHIDAAPDEVYDLWANYENFPRFMSHVVEVRDLGRRRSHWVVKGPGGTEFAWNSVLTEQSRPHRLAWRSEPGAEIPQSGSIQFERHRGGTLVTVRMSYTPPAGALGHGLAVLLGSDPKAQMDDDLARMKAFIERGAVPRDAAQPRSASRFLH
jgi:uncharacterized membrane protein